VENPNLWKKAASNYSGCQIMVQSKLIFKKTFFLKYIKRKNSHGVLLLWRLMIKETYLTALSGAYPIKIIYPHQMQKIH